VLKQKDSADGGERSIPLFDAMVFLYGVVDDLLEQSFVVNVC